jgi:hypothetical protein
MDINMDEPEASPYFFINDEACEMLHEVYAETEAKTSKLKQELLRCARAGSRRTTVSIYDKKTESYNTPNAATDSAIVKIKALKSKNALATSGIPTSGDSPLAIIAPEEEEPEPEPEPDPDEADNDDEALDGEAGKKVKKVEERTFTLNKWTAVPPALADKMEEKRYLAARRPGMSSLYGRNGYGNESANGNTLPLAIVTGDAGTGTAGANGAAAAAAAAGSGSGSGIDAADGNASATTATELKPTRTMPPKRKKRLGGPGRKKANLGAVAVPAVAGEGTTAENVHAAGAGKEDESESEEGSEEGEIDERTPGATEAEPAIPAAAAAEPKQVDAPEEMEIDLLGSLDAAIDKDMEVAREGKAKTETDAAE